MIRDEDIIEDLKKFFDSKGRKREYIGYLIVAKARDLKSCHMIIYDHDQTPKLRLSKDIEYGNIKVISKANYYEDYKIEIGKDRDFDTLFIVGIDREKKVINKVFAIPKIEVLGKRFMTITKKGPKYQKYAIDDKPYINIYNDIKNGKYSILKDGDITIEKEIIT